MYSDYWNNICILHISHCRFLPGYLPDAKPMEVWMKLLLCTLCFVLMLCSVFAIDWVSNQYIGMPGVSFAGESAVQAVDDTIYIAYLSRVTDSVARLHFTKATATFVYTTEVMNHLYYPIEMGPGAPSIAVNLPQIQIMVKGANYLYRCSSDDYGTQWTCQGLGGGIVDGNDPYPIVAASDAGFRNFTVKAHGLSPDCMLFVDEHVSMNDTNVYFYGPDVVDGQVWANSDLWIKQVGGGTNNGWPTFWNLVVVAGNVVSTPPNFPLDQVFRGGLIQNADAELFRPNLPLYRQTFITEAEFVGLQDNDDHIVLLEVDGNTASGWLGTYSPPNRVFADVYNLYPSLNSTYLFRNNFEIVDTLWTQIAPFTLPEKLYTTGTLWLKGTFSGQHSIYSTSDIYLIGDILLSGTPAGTSPVSNSFDKVSLISDKQILLKYGYKHPADSLRYHPNCKPDTQATYIYADLLALRKNPQNPRKSGMFSYEYQHPHPSVPAVNITLGDELQYFDWIDLHRRAYPQTTASPWPAAIDYPWYNPLWPERAPYKERGIVQLWGSLYQDRMGYMHRSGNDSEYPSHSGVWNIDLDMCGGPTNVPPVNDSVIPGMNLGAVNYPGATGSGTGYKKQYSYDPRIFVSMPRRDVWGLGALITESSGQEDALVKWHKLNEPVVHKSLDYYGGHFLYHLNNTLYTDQEALPPFPLEDWEILQAKRLSTGRIITLQRSSDSQPPDNRQPRDYRLMLSNLDWTNQSVIHQGTYIQKYISLNRIADGFLYVIPNETDSTATIVRLDHLGQILSSDGILPLVPGFEPNQEVESRIVLENPASGILHACMWAKLAPQGFNFWHLTGTIDQVSATDPVAVPATISMRCYPNPFREQLNLEVKSNGNQPVALGIYNLKGQKVRSLMLQVHSDKGSISWDGKDDSGRSLSPGLYFVKIADQEHSSTTKILKIK